MKNGKLAEYSKQAADKGYQIIAHLMTTLNRIKTYIPRKHKDLHGKLDTLYSNLQEVKTRIHKAFADIASQLSEKIGKMLDEAKGDTVEAQTKTTAKKQQAAKEPTEGSSTYRSTNRAGVNKINTGSGGNCTFCVLGGASSPQRTSSDIADTLKLEQTKGLKNSQFLDAAYLSGFKGVKMLPKSFSSMESVVDTLKLYPNGTKFAVDFDIPTGATRPDGHIFNAFKSKNRVLFKDYQQNKPVFRDSEKVIDAFKKTDYENFRVFILEEGLQ